MEVGPFKVAAPKVQAEWDSAPYASSPEGVVSADTFFTNENGSRIVFYLTGGDHARLWADMDRFVRLASSALWQQVLAREYVSFGRHRALRVFSTLGPLVQVQYFFEAASATLLVVGCTFGPAEAVSALRFDSLLAGFDLTDL
jgi:hypothetical protein